MVKSRINSGVKNKKKTLKKVRPNMSLYADYHPESSVKGFGYKNKDVALKTITKLEKMDKNGELEKKLIGPDKTIDAEQIENKIRSYKLQVVNTMYNRAKFHKFRSNDMLGAMKVFKEYLSELKDSKKSKGSKVKKEKKIKGIKRSKKEQVRSKNKK